MIGLRLGFDKLNSLLASYHILCAPTELNMKYNQGIFTNLSVSDEQRERYMDFLPYKKKNTDPDSIVPDLIFPKARTLDYLFSHCEVPVPSKVKKDLRDFEKASAPYFKDFASSLEPVIMKRKQQVVTHLQEIYDTAQEFTGVSITRPKELDVCIVEGFAPQAMGSVVSNGFGYVVISPNNFSRGGKFMDILVHEAVAHQTVDESRKLMRQVFGKYVYDVEEGFAKMFSTKITGKMMTSQSHPDLYGPLEKLSNGVFEKNWSSLRGDNFDSWYLGCLKEIKAKIENGC